MPAFPSLALTRALAHAHNVLVLVAADTADKVQVAHAVYAEPGRDAERERLRQLETSKCKSVKRDL
jgi:hypothetical protein